MAVIELVEELKSVVAEAEKARGTRSAPRKAPTGRTKEIAEDAAAESATAAAVAADAADGDAPSDSDAVTLSRPSRDEGLAALGLGRRRRRGRRPRPPTTCSAATPEAGGQETRPRTDEPTDAGRRRTSSYAARRTHDEAGPLAAGPPRRFLRRHRVLRLGASSRAGAPSRPCWRTRWRRCCGCRPCADGRRAYRRRRARHRPGRARRPARALWAAERDCCCAGWPGCCRPTSGCRAVRAVPADFDARFSALWRRYEYRISDAPAGADPLRRGIRPGLAPPAGRRGDGRGRGRLLGLHDFAAFCRRRDGRDDDPHLQRLDVARAGDELVCTVRRRRVLPLDGALAGRCAARGGGGAPRRSTGRRRCSTRPARRRGHASLDREVVQRRAAEDQHRQHHHLRRAVRDVLPSGSWCW